jgi:hypothetical protein
MDRREARRTAAALIDPAPQSRRRPDGRPRDQLAQAAWSRNSKPDKDAASLLALRQARAGGGTGDLLACLDYVERRAARLKERGGRHHPDEEK